MESTKTFTLITGATQGIGYELAKCFAQDKHNLVLVARDAGELEDCASEFRTYGIDVETFSCDLFSRKETKNLCQEIDMRKLLIDHLVNNAGQGVYGLFKDNELQRELDILDLNIAATLILTKHFLQGMVSRNNGKILNLASIASAFPGPWQAVYHGTKAFVLSFSEALNSELKEVNVSITALLPGVTDTDFFNKAGMNQSKMVQDNDAMADPAKVARDGYEALMEGKDKIVSGLKNKMQVAMSNLLPDEALAEQMKKMQEPTNE